MRPLQARREPFILQDGDRVHVQRVADEDVNAVYLYGNLKRPGKYQFRPGLRVSDMIAEKDLQPETDLSYAFVKRHNKPEMAPALVAFKLGDAILRKAPAEDLALQPYDEIYIFRQWDFQSRPDITISGEIRNPGKYPLQKNTRLKDALFMAGGPNANAYLAQAHLYRTDPRTREVTMVVTDLSPRSGRARRRQPPLAGQGPHRGSSRRGVQTGEDRDRRGRRPPSGAVPADGGNDDPGSSLRGRQRHGGGLAR